MHSLVPVDEAGLPLAPALTWADQRAAPQALSLRSEVDGWALYRRTGCPVQSIYHLAKLRWWHEAEPELARRAARFVTLKDWVCWRLTGAWTTDIGLASTTGLLDIHRLAWDTEALRLAGITAGKLPNLVRPEDVVGAVTSAAAADTGLAAGLPVVAGSSDGATANLGSGAVQPGQSVITLGTSGAVRRVVAQPLLDPAQRTWCYVSAEGHWFAGGAINNAGLALQWVRERFYPDVSGDAGYQQLMQDAAGVAPGAAGVRLLPYFTGERSPHWNPEARAQLSGLGLAHTRAHIARAVLEGVAYCLADVWEVLNAGVPSTASGTASAPSTASGTASTPSAGGIRLTGNVTHSPVWAQIVADVLGVKLLADEAADASALGAAFMGHLALGHLARLEDVAAALPPGLAYVPDLGRHEQYRAEHRAFQALYRAMLQTERAN
jgi:gluconokinase